MSLNRIDELVAQRLSSKGRSSVKSEPPKVRAMRLAWERLANQSLYLLSIEIKVGVRQSARLRPPDIGLDADTIDRLQKAEASGGYSPKISRKLKDYAEQLRAAQKKLYEQYTVYAYPFRFIQQEHLPAAMQAIEIMQEQAEECRIQLVEVYSDEFRNFLERVSFVLEAKLEGDQLIEALDFYAEGFPDIDAFADALQIVVNGPTKISSLAEQLKQDAVLQKQMADSAVDAQQKQVEVTKLKALEQGYRVMERSLGQAFLELQNESKSQGFDVLADLLDRAGVKADSGGLTRRDAAAWTTLIDRLKVLTVHNADLEPLLKEAQTLYDAYQDANEPDQIQAILADFKKFLLSTLKRETKHSSEGLDRLQRAIRFQDEYQSLKAEVEKLGATPSPIAIQQLLTKLTGYEESARFRIEALKRDLKKAEKRAATATTTEQPYIDPEAGF